MPRRLVVGVTGSSAPQLAGATVLPPVPAFYHQPESVDDLLRQTAGKVLDQFHIEHNAFRRWR